MILLTAPHSFCLPSIPVRHCDRVAGEAAKKLHSLLSNSVLILSTHLRSEVDLNRSESADTDFAKLIDETQNISLCIDVHSFPDHKLDDNDVYVLVNHRDKGLDKVLSLLHKHIKFNEYQGGKENYILEKMHARGVPAFIMELHEGDPSLAALARFPLDPLAPLGAESSGFLK